MDFDSGSPERFPPEVSVAVAAQYLGSTERTVINYLKSRQLKGKKVGKRWFIETASLFELRPPGVALREVSLPPLENPLNINQEQRGAKKRIRAKDWQLIKSPQRNPMRLNCFVRLKEATSLLDEIDDLTEHERCFFESALFEVGDDLGAGYYSFGPVKRKLYGRARTRSGRIVSRGLLHGIPPGLVMCFCQLAEAVSSLCRSMDKRRMVSTQRPASLVEESRCES